MKSRKPKVIVVREVEERERVVYRDRPAPASTPYTLPWWEDLWIWFATICGFVGIFAVAILLVAGLWFVSPALAVVVAALLIALFLAWCKTS